LRQHPNHLLEEGRVPGGQLVEIAAPHRENQPFGDADGALAAPRIVHEGPGAEGLARTHFRRDASAGHEAHAPLDDEVERVRRVLLAVDLLVTGDFDLLRQVGEREQVPRANLLQEIGPLQDEHPLDRGQHRTPATAAARGRDGAGPAASASISARTIGSPPSSSKTRRSNPGTWREARTATARSQASPSFQAERIHSARRSPATVSPSGGTASSSTTRLTVRNTPRG